MAYLRDFAEIGSASLGIVVQYATGVPQYIFNKNSKLLFNDGICNQQVAGSTPVASSS
jgi:hypothetical protein